MRPRRVAFMLAGLAALLVACANAQPEKQVVARARERIEAERPHKWALIVGVNRYEDDDIQNLSCSVADANSIYAVLTAPEIGGFAPGNVVLLTDETARKPTRSNVLEALATLADTAEPQDTVLFYFSGHGTEDRGDGYLLPSDARLATVRWTAVPLQAVLEVRERSGCRVQIVLIDACRRDLEIGQKGQGALSEDMAAALFSDVEGVAVLSSTSPGQASYEDPDSGQSVYTRFVVEGLRGAADAELAGNGDGLVSVHEAAEYARAHVRSWGMQHGRTQSPRLRLEAGGEIVLTMAPLPESAPAPVEPIGTTAALRVEGAEGATIFIDGVQRGTAPCEVEVDLGPLQEKQVEAVAQLTGYRSAAARITLRRGGTAPWRPELVPITPAPAPAPAPSGKPWERPGTRAAQEIVGPAGIPLVWVPGGSFMMGSTDEDVAYAVRELDAEREWLEDEQPVHRVELSGFWIGKTEVTVAQWRSVMGSVPQSDAQDGEHHPVVHVPWDDCVEFCEKAGLELPTEAQWEYAARGPDSRRYPWGDGWDEDRLCWRENQGPGGRTFPVGSFPSGASWCGALDMAGNVWEWCADWHDEDYYATAPPRDPPGPSSGRKPVLRGGSWDFSANLCRAAFRLGYGPTDRGLVVGFRVARSCR